MRNSTQTDDDSQNDNDDTQKNQTVFKKKWTKKNQSVYNFRGDTPGMGGYVFQVNGEHRKKGQFRETMERLRVYSAEHHKKHSKTLAVLFNDLTKPEPDKPKKPSKTTFNNDEGKSVTEISEFDKEMYKADIKCYVAEKRDLDQTLASLYEVVWGQCSKLMQ